MKHSERKNAENKDCEKTYRKTADNNCALTDVNCPENVSTVDVKIVDVPFFRAFDCIVFGEFFEYGKLFRF